MHLFRFNIKQIIGWILIQIPILAGLFTIIRTSYMLYFAIMFKDRWDIFTYWYASPIRYYTPVFAASVAITGLISLFSLLKLRISLLNAAIALVASSLFEYNLGYILRDPANALLDQYTVVSIMYPYGLILMAIGITLLLLKPFKRFFFYNKPPDTITYSQNGTSI